MLSRPMPAERSQSGKVARVGARILECGLDRSGWRLLFGMVGERAVSSLCRVLAVPPAQGQPWERFVRCHCL